MQVHHTLHDVVDDLQLLLLREFCLLYVQLIIETAILHELCHQLVPVDRDAQPHIQHDVWVFQITQNVHLFHKLFSAFVTATCLHVVLHCHWVLHVPASRHFTIPSFAYGLNDFDIFLLYKKI